MSTGRPADLASKFGDGRSIMIDGQHPQSTSRVATLATTRSPPLKPSVSDKSNRKSAPADCQVPTIIPGSRFAKRRYGPRCGRRCENGCGADQLRDRPFRRVRGNTRNSRESIYRKNRNLPCQVRRTATGTCGTATPRSS